MTLVDNYKQQISSIHRKIKKIQALCPHDNTKKTHSSHDCYNDGVTYYTNFTCLVCGKQWEEEGTK